MTQRNESENISVLFVSKEKLRRYPRGKVLENVLKTLDVQVDLCEGNSFADMRRVVQMLRQNQHDVVLVYGRPYVVLAKLFSKTPVVFDPFVSVYDMRVRDRKIVSPFSPHAWVLWLSDWLGCALAERVIVDTNVHIEYFCQLLRLKDDKFRRVWVGTNDKLFVPISPKKHERFTVWFHGTFIPLQGIVIILQAAKLLEGENLQFSVTGDGQMRKTMLALHRRLNLQNVTFFPPVAYQQLPHLMCRAHIALGIFGSTPKAMRVIPNKTFEALACGMPLVTGASPATTEAGLIHQDNCLLTPMGKAEPLANAILELKQDSKLRSAIGKQGRELYLNKFSNTHIAKDLMNVLDGTLKRNY